MRRSASSARPALHISIESSGFSRAFIFQLSKSAQGGEDTAVADQRMRAAAALALLAGAWKLPPRPAGPALGATHSGGPASTRRTAGSTRL